MNMRVLLVDDENLVREALADFLARVLSVEVTAHADCKGALVALRGGGFDLVLLDIRLPGTDGLACLERMLKSADVPVLMLTGHLDHKKMRMAFALGAKGVVSKNLDPELLIKVVDLVMAGMTYVPEELLEAEERFGNLIAREQEVLILLAEGHTNKAIATRLGIKEITVKVHLQKVFRKLSVSNRTQAVRVALPHLGGS